MSKGSYQAPVPDDSNALISRADELSKSNQPTLGTVAVAKDIRSVSVAQRRHKSRTLGRARKRLRVVRKTLQKTVLENGSKLLF